MKNSFKTEDVFQIDGKMMHFFHLERLKPTYNLDRLPFVLKILLENLLRYEDEHIVRRSDIEALLNWDPHAAPHHEISFTPSRVLLQDFTGVPTAVDLAAMRYAMADLGGDPNKINPLSPVELVIDHSVMADYSGTNASLGQNNDLEFQRNKERYTFLRWAQEALQNFRVVPPNTGIVHQVNLEYLARVVFTKNTADGKIFAYPDTLVGTDSHTTMINGLGVLGWGVGGIEAEAAMLGQPVTMLIPEVIGVELRGRLKEGTSATDLVLCITERLRKKGVVNKFVEFFGEGLDHLPLADRATIANMAPEYGATAAIFPIDEETLRFLALSGRDKEQIALVEQYSKQQGFFRHQGEGSKAEFSDTVSLDLNTVEPSLAGPKRPQDRVLLTQSKAAYTTAIEELLKRPQTEQDAIPLSIEKQEFKLTHGDVVIAAITSCTNTSNPAVMIAAGLVAKKARAKGLRSKPWVKTSLAPGSQVVTDYLKKADLLADLEALGFYLVGYGCTTCIGNSGPLPAATSAAIKKGDLHVTAVLSGNRNFEGRIHPEVRFAYLASPPLVVAYALAGTMNIDLYQDPLGYDTHNQAVYLKDIWPSQAEVHTLMHTIITSAMFIKRYKHVFEGDSLWQGLDVPSSNLFQFDPKSTYIKHPPYFENIQKIVPPLQAIEQARILAILGDSVTTDHISPAGNIDKTSPAGLYLQQLGITYADFNSYGSRRGNHEVMLRGTFANIRLKNALVPGTEGGFTVHSPSGEHMSIYDAAMRYKTERCPLLIFAGKEYGTGSSRDWAAKGTFLLGVKAVIAQSFERIHRSNLIGMGVLPLEFLEGQSIKTAGIVGQERFDIALHTITPSGTLDLTMHTQEGTKTTLTVKVRIDTPKELEYFQHGGILQYVLRELLKTSS